MPPFASPGFDAVAAFGRTAQPRAGEVGSELTSHALAMLSPLIGLRLQAMMDMESKHARTRTGGNVQQRGGVEAAAESDRNNVRFSEPWCR